MKKVDFLSGVSLFALMRKTELEGIAALAHHVLYNTGEVIIMEGETDKQLFIIVSGEVDVIRAMGTKDERHLRTLGPQSYFGEMALIDNLVRSASVVAKEKTELLCLHQWNLRKEIERCPAIAVELLQMLSKRIRAIEKRMMNSLGDYLPTCAGCKKIREQDGSWTPIEKYISEHSETEFTHSICPECSETLYPQFYVKD